MKLLTLATPGGLPLMAAVVADASPGLAATRLIPALRSKFALPPDVSFRFRDLTTEELSAMAAAQPA